MSATQLSFPCSSSEFRICYENQSLEQRTETVNKIIEICKKMCSTRDSSFGFEKTCLGATGTTFLCSIRGNLLGDYAINAMDLPRCLRDKDNTPFLDSLGANVLLKYVKKDLAYNERFCAEFLKKFGFETPDLYFSDQIEKSDIRGLAIGDSNVLVCMYEFPAATLNSLVITGVLYQLSLIDFQNVLFDIGQIVIFDLLIANEDRFFRYDTTTPGKIIKFINEGNIMFNLSPVSDRSNQRVWKSTYYIDNTTKSQLCPQIIDQISNLVDLKGSIFACDSGSEDQSSDELDSKIVDANFIELDKFTQAFTYYADEIHHDELAEIVGSGIRDFLMQTNDDELSEHEASFQDLELLKNSLKGGFKKAVITLNERTVDVDHFIHDAEQTIGVQNSFCQITIDLIKLAIRSLQVART